VRHPATTQKTPALSPDPTTVHPLRAHERVVFLNPLVTSPNITVGEYTYDDDPDGATDFEHRNVLYAYGPERLVIGKYCAIATGTTFLMAGAEHPTMGVSTYLHDRRRQPGQTDPAALRRRRRRAAAARRVVGLARRPGDRTCPHHHGRDTHRHRTHRHRARTGEVTLNHLPQISVEEHTVADHAAGPYALTTGPHGAVWTALEIGSLARITPPDSTA
jgi:hypothetical protein